VTRRRIPAALSRLEEELALTIRAHGLPAPEREVRFHPTRRWRFDFAWPDRMIAVECEGGTSAPGRSRHGWGSGFESDCEKYNEAALRGWTVLRFTMAMIQDGRAVATIDRALGNPGPKED
jgi:very-short-patch-repair endonuclease